LSLDRREDRGAKVAEVERLRRENRSAEGAKGVGCSPSPENFWISDIKMVSFCAFWVHYLPFSCLFYTQKNGAFGLPKLKLSAACAHAEIERHRDREREERQSRNKNPSKVQIILH